MTEAARAACEQQAKRLRTKLDNMAFVDTAPGTVVDETRRRLTELEKLLAAPGDAVTMSD